MNINYVYNTHCSQINILSCINIMGNSRYKISIYTQGSWKKYERHFFLQKHNYFLLSSKRTTKSSYSHYLDRWHVFKSWEKLNTWSLEKNLQLRKPLEPIMKRHYIPKKYDTDAVSLYELNCKCAFNFCRMCLYSKTVVFAEVYGHLNCLFKTSKYP